MTALAVLAGAVFLALFAWVTGRVLRAAAAEELGPPPTVCWRGVGDASPGDDADVSARAADDTSPGAAQDGSSSEYSRDASPPGAPDASHPSMGDAGVFA